jgi:DNA-directed RNA polymerase specialized sigma24 family protein
MQHIKPAEDALHERYREYCGAQLRRLGLAVVIPWGRFEDDEAAVDEAMLAILPPKACQAVDLCQYEKLSRHQIADRLGIWRWTVAIYLMRARQRLAKRPMLFEQWLYQQASR